MIGALDNLDLSLLLNGEVVATANSLIDNVEHLFFVLPETGNYSLRVDRLAVVGSGSETTFGLAWSATAVPEPTTLWIGLAAMIGLMTRRRRD